MIERSMKDKKESFNEFTLRLNKKDAERLNKIIEIYEVSKTEAIRRIIRKAYKELMQSEEEVF